MNDQPETAHEKISNAIVKLGGEFAALLLQNVPGALERFAAGETLHVGLAFENTGRGILGATLMLDGQATQLDGPREFVGVIDPGALN